MTNPVGSPDTPALDAFFTKYDKGVRYVMGRGIAEGWTDYGLIAYDRAVSVGTDWGNKPIDPAEIAAVPITEVIHARAWQLAGVAAANQNGGFNVGEGKNETPLPQSAVQAPTVKPETTAQPVAVGAPVSDPLAATPAVLMTHAEVEAYVAKILAAQPSVPPAPPRTPIVVPPPKPKPWYKRLWDALP